MLSFFILLVLFMNEIFDSSCVWLVDKCLQLGQTALMMAAQKGLVDCVRVLLERGADKEALDHVRVRDMIQSTMKFWGRFLHKCFYIYHIRLVSVNSFTFTAMLYCAGSCA